MSRLWKFAWVVLLVCFVMLFRWYHELDLKHTLFKLETRAYFKAQNEALADHARVFNGLSDIIEIQQNTLRTHHELLSVIFAPPKDSKQKPAGA